VPGYLFVNPRAGDGRPPAEELAEAARERGLEPHVLRAGDDAAELARRADADAIGVAGGDGSLAPLAAVAIDRDLPFVCVPLGTRNHFAGDLGLDRRDPFGALDAFAGGRELRVDVARVNGRLFLNNASLGVYAGLVHGRETHRRRRETLARARALVRIVGERHRLRVRVDGEPLAARILVVANNAYELDMFTLGARPRLDEGKLYLYAADGWLPRDWTTRTGDRFAIEAPQASVRAAVDGEPVVLEPPLRFEIRPRALRVLVPPERREAGL
jgi:diacylglycerol kinase family enzyme